MAKVNENISSHIKKFQELKESNNNKAEKLVLDIFPQKAVFLSEILLDERLSDADVKESVIIPLPPGLLKNSDEFSPVNKKRKADDNVENNAGNMHLVPTAMIPCNVKVKTALELIKPFIKDLIHHANEVKMWIAYMIPKIEDGNNFGVSVQEDAMAEARQVESEAATYFDQLTRYYMTRGKLISKVLKYPHIEDYRATVKELDDKEMTSLRLVVMELRNHYASLHDLCKKNLSKIKQPRSSHSDHMY